jgi:hypothetical protein
VDGLEAADQSRVDETTASRIASGPRVGSTLTNGMAMSEFAEANASTSSFDTCRRPDSRSSTVNTTQASFRER